MNGLDECQKIQNGYFEEWKKFLNEVGFPNILVEEIAKEISSNYFSVEDVRNSESLESLFSLKCFMGRIGLTMKLKNILQNEKNVKNASQKKISSKRTTIKKTVISKKSQRTIGEKLFQHQKKVNEHEEKYGRGKNIIVITLLNEKDEFYEWRCTICASLGKPHVGSGDHDAIVFRAKSHGNSKRHKNSHKEWEGKGSGKSAFRPGIKRKGRSYVSRTSSRKKRKYNNNKKKKKKKKKDSSKDGSNNDVDYSQKKDSEFRCRHGDKVSYVSNNGKHAGRSFLWFCQLNMRDDNRCDDRAVVTPMDSDNQFFRKPNFHSVLGYWE